MDNKRIVLILIAFISFFIMTLSGEKDAFLHISSFVIVAFFSAWAVDFKLHHPLFLYISFFTLYSIGYSTLWLLGIHFKYGYSKEAMFCMLLGQLICILILPVKNVKQNFKNYSYNNVRTQKIIKNLSIVLSFCTYIGIVYVITSGFANKKDIYNNGGLIINLICKMVYINMFYILLYMVLSFLKNDTRNYMVHAFNISSVVLFGIITGERDYMFHMLMIIVLLLSFWGKIKRKHIPVLALGGIIALVVSKVFKYYFLSGASSGGISFEASNIFIEFLNGEFTSAGRNMQILVSGNYYDYFEGRSLIMDLVRIFYSVDFFSSRWFNDVVLYDVINTGYGFTIVGEGYINGGYIGIVLVMIVVALLLKYLYQHNGKNIYYFAAYVYMLPQFIYATRADITNILSPLLKHVLLAVLLLFVVIRIFGGKTMSISRKTL